jgi:5-formyltetrahydrofolate cyclo-ligase
MATVSIEEFKADLRKTSLARRDAISAETRAAAALAAAQIPLPIDIAPGMVVSGFSPLKSEMNPIPLMRRFADAGAGLALPVVAGRNKPLIMRSYAFGQPLNSGVWGIREPFPDAEEVLPDVMIVPLAAFDSKGHRIGYGAGYYDMTINRLRLLKPVTTIGFAYAAQQVAVVPTEPHDARLDYVLTEREVIKCRK